MKKKRKEKQSIKTLPPFNYHKDMTLFENMPCLYWDSIKNSPPQYMECKTAKVYELRKRLSKNYRGIAVHENSVYVCGSGTNDKKCTRYMCNFAENSIHTEQLPTLNVGRSKSAAEIVMGKYLYSIGGCGSGYGFTGICEKLVLGETKWKRICPMNEAVGCCSVCCFNNRLLYRVGGFTGRFAEYSNIIEVLDILEETQGWKVIATKKTGWFRCEFPGCIQYANTKILVFGGRDYDQTYIVHKSCFEIIPHKQQIRQASIILDSEVLIANSKPVLCYGQLYAVDYEEGKIIHIDIVPHYSEERYYR